MWFSSLTRRIDLQDWTINVKPRNWTDHVLNEGKEIQMKWPYHLYPPAANSGEYPGFSIPKKSAMHQGVSSYGLGQGARILDKEFLWCRLCFCGDNFNELDTKDAVVIDEESRWILQFRKLNHAWLARTCACSLESMAHCTTKYSNSSKQVMAGKSY